MQQKMIYLHIYVKMNLQLQPNLLGLHALIIEQLNRLAQKLISAKTLRALEPFLHISKLLLNPDERLFASDERVNDASVEVTA